MSQTVVIESNDIKEQEELAEIHAKYEEILSRFSMGETPSQREQVMIEKKIVAMFSSAMGSGDSTDAEHREKMEAVLDVATVATGIVSTLWAVNNAASSGAFDLAGAIHNAAFSLATHSLGILGSASALAPILMVIVSGYNLYRALQTGKRVKEANDTFVKWDKYYMSELNKAQAGAERAVQEMTKYFVTREALLRMKDPSRTSAIQYEMGMQMARCMSQVEHKITRYQELIDKAEQTLAAIEENAVELETTARRNKRRGWVAVVVGGVLAITGVAMINIVASGGTALIPIATAVAGLATGAAGGYVVHLSRQQLESLKSLRGNIDLARNQLGVHRTVCAQLQEQVMEQIQKANGYVTEAEKDAIQLEKEQELRRQLAEARAQNEAIGRRMSRIQAASSNSNRGDGSEVMEILAQYRLEKYYDLVVDELGVEDVDDIGLIDEDSLAGVACKPIVKKRLLKMAREVGNA